MYTPTRRKKASKTKDETSKKSKRDKHVIKAKIDDLDDVVIELNEISDINESLEGRVTQRLHVPYQAEKKKKKANGAIDGVLKLGDQPIGPKVDRTSLWEKTVDSADDDGVAVRETASSDGLAQDVDAEKKKESRRSKVQAMIEEKKKKAKMSSADFKEAEKEDGVGPDEKKEARRLRVEKAMKASKKDLQRKKLDTTDSTTIGETSDKMAPAVFKEAEKEDGVGPDEKKEARRLRVEKAMKASKTNQRDATLSV